jgi:two-component system sensor histidine kinase FlrB
MAASLAHQLRTPLATALLYSANLAKAELSDDARTRFAEKATEQLKRLERLIQDVLLFARGEHIGREVITVAGLLSEAAQTLEPLCAARGVEYRREGEAGEAIIVGSRKSLSGALLNLLENALQVCEVGGAVTLKVAVLGKRVSLSVRDTGPGVAPEQQARIFEPFFTTKGQGTGLGLAIALGVARAHGGSIDVLSRPGEGAEFVMELPAGTTADIQE